MHTEPRGTKVKAHTHSRGEEAQRDMKHNKELQQKN
jgi:hypothetical protein